MVSARTIVNRESTMQGKTSDLQSTILGNFGNTCGKNSTIFLLKHDNFQPCCSLEVYVVAVRIYVGQLGLKLGAK